MDICHADRTPWVDVVRGRTFLPGFLGLLAISMFLNAITGKWAFDRSVSGGLYVVLDVVIGAALAVASYVTWRRR